MSKLSIELLNCRKVGTETRRAVEDVFCASFASGDQLLGLDPYFNNVRQLLLARDGEKIVGFQFYQTIWIADCRVHHFSLAGRLDDTRYRGLQAQFGRFIIRQSIFITPLLRPLYLVGVTNNPKSYVNFYAVGGKRFPDVQNPVENPFGDWYQQVARQLGMDGVDERGLLHHRMQNLGFRLKEASATNHPMSQAYNRYVGGNHDHGVFTMVELLPVRDLPIYLMRQLFKRFLRRSNEKAYEQT